MQNYWVIPDFRPTEETEIDGWCRKTSAVRDLLLSGDLQAAADLAADHQPGDIYVAGRSCVSVIRSP